MKERLLSFMGDMAGPSTFAEHRQLLDTPVLRFPEGASVPKDPTSVYGKEWEIGVNLTINFHLRDQAQISW